jgi:hypothetical protein
VIWVKRIALVNKSGSSRNPGAKATISHGIKNSTARTKIINTNIRLDNVSLANLLADSFPSSSSF